MLTSDDFLHGCQETVDIIWLGIITHQSDTNDLAVKRAIAATDFNAIIIKQFAAESCGIDPGGNFDGIDHRQAVTLILNQQLPA